MSMYRITDASQGWPVAIANTKEEARKVVENYNGECCVWDENNNEVFDEIFTEDELEIKCTLWKEYYASSVWLCTPDNLDMEKHWHVYGDYAGFTRSEAVENFKQRLSKCGIAAKVIITDLT